ncbi:unnamed protein product [Hyaloperonospora brassicae]|uniref:Uncharacterized protein n=1 Tax=Hyaloperonospora brassicae TaxID=162125 RepID=A0AAV0T7C1_HYABA|nr:unnamed protein product [Hyaloperonospora brassicae]
MSPSRAMKFTSDGIPKNWDGKDWQTYKWAMPTVFEENQLEHVVDGTITAAMLQTATAEKQEEFELKQVKIKRMETTAKVSLVQVIPRSAYPTME